MPSVVSICNMALSHIGNKAVVSSITPPYSSAEAEACAVLYPLALGTLLDLHNWSFATRRTTLAQRSDLDPAPWLYAYSLPSGFRRAINLEPVLDTDEDDDSTLTWSTPYFGKAYVQETPQVIEFEIMNADTGMYICTDLAPQARLRYVMASPTPGMFPPAFVDALAWLLASHLVGRIVRGESGYQQTQSCLKYFTSSLAVATKADSRQTRIKARRLPVWIKARL